MYLTQLFWYKKALSIAPTVEKHVEVIKINSRQTCEWRIVVKHRLRTSLLSIQVRFGLKATLLDGKHSLRVNNDTYRPTVIKYIGHHYHWTSFYFLKREAFIAQWIFKQRIKITHTTAILTLKPTNISNNNFKIKSYYFSSPYISNRH